MTSRASNRYTGWRHRIRESTWDSRAAYTLWYDVRKIYTPDSEWEEYRKRDWMKNERRKIYVKRIEIKSVWTIDRLTCSHWVASVFIVDNWSPHSSIHCIFSITFYERNGTYTQQSHSTNTHFRSQKKKESSTKWNRIKSSRCENFAQNKIAPPTKHTKKRIENQTVFGCRKS